MINFQFFPRSHGVTPRIREIIECFKAVDKEKDASVHLKSNDMLALCVHILNKLALSLKQVRLRTNRYLSLYCSARMMKLISLLLLMH